MSFITYGQRDSDGNYCTCNVACNAACCNCGCKSCITKVKVIERSIEEVKKEYPIVNTGMEVWIDCSKSSNLANIKYSSDTKELQVKFKDKNSGVYEGVSQEDFDGLLNAESRGSYLHTVIKPKYKYRKLTLVK